MVIERKHKNKILNIKLDKKNKTNCHGRGSRTLYTFSPQP